MSDPTLPVPAPLRFDASTLMDRLDDMAELLRACVEDGASINFVRPFSSEAARAFWLDKVMPGLEEDLVTLFVATDGERLAGTVYLDFRMPPNQNHRADLKKLMVHPAWRRRGIARQLMEAAEREVAARGRRLITLDTRTGDIGERLYRDIGYLEVGRIPDFSLAVDGDHYDGCTFFFKAL